MSRQNLFILGLSVLAIVLVVTAASPAVGLMAGAVIGLMVGNPAPKLTRTLARHALTAAVIGLGGDVPLGVVVEAGLAGLSYTAVGIALTLAAGFALAKVIVVPGKVAFLVSAGTAICGGSAIAAVGPVVEAEEHEITVALATVFILNAVALLLFPPLGRALGFTPQQFGVWAALGIHDTSSVVGAAVAFGPAAVPIATAIKLARALWIVPLTLGAAYVYQRSGATKARPPLPIAVIGFVAFAALVAAVDPLAPLGHGVAIAAKRLMTVTLMLIGASLTRLTLRSVGAKPLLHGVVLWLFAATVSWVIAR